MQGVERRREEKTAAPGEVLCGGVRRREGGENRIEGGVPHVLRALDRRECLVRQSRALEATVELQQGLAFVEAEDDILAEEEKFLARATAVRA